VELARLSVIGQADLKDPDTVTRLYASVTPGAEWNGQRLSYPDGRIYPNVVLIYQDTYVFGTGFLGTARLNIPVKYRSVTAEGFERRSGL
jgi:hypothetical protein